MITESESSELISLLQERLSVISDQDLRNNNPGEQLVRLKSVSEKLFAQHAVLKGRLDSHLDHYLTNCSYDKALAFLSGE